MQKRAHLHLPYAFFPENRKALSDVITTLIIVLLSLVAIGIVWVVISNIIKSGEQQTSFQFGTLFLDLQLEKVTVNADDSVSVTVKRGVGEGELAGVAFVFSDGEKSITLKKTVVLSELGSQSFSFTQAELEGISFVKQVEIAPILSSDNKEQVGRVVDIEKINYYSSCLNIKNAGESKGSGIYWIDPDESGALIAFRVYCDMTTDGGGWTLIYSSQDDGTGDNNMQQGTKETAVITTLDPGNANKKIAYDILKSLNFNDILFSGYRDYDAQSNRITFWILNRKQDFINFIDFGIGRDVTDSDRCSAGKSFFGTEAQTGRPVGMTWENYALIVGNVPSGCAWAKEVWNEIDAHGGHILAAQNWDNGEYYLSQNDIAGAAHNKGLYHMFLR